MLEAIKKRRSCRNFNSLKPVEEEKLNEVIEAGLNAPSAKNTQEGIIIAITNKVVRDKVSLINKRIMGVDKDIDPFYGAPVILVVAARKWALSQYDGSTMIENMLVEATNQSLASIWIHRAKQEFEDPEFIDLLKDTGIDFNEYEGIGHVALGYPSDDNTYSDKEIKEGRVFYVK